MEAGRDASAPGYQRRARSRRLPSRRIGGGHRDHAQGL